MHHIAHTRLHATALAFAASLAAALLPGGALAQAHDHAGHGAQEPAAAPAAAGQDLSEGEVMRWDARTSKVTLRHGELKNLGMPPMTMVFQLRVPSPAPALKPGDKVRFRAEQDSGGFVVTVLEVQG
ncbi:copper-binding protein [Delftia sp. PS-11]|uniref:copper-binding protein n=1 Tax=Delftia sp. PS-11 TaxID=2767222 RepID=UPI002457B51D|nr:copper-binding protein [Delftia sp. PS-11]KAJ8742232.1 copper-binding protein [Delftia sp. PS-11]